VFRDAIPVWVKDFNKRYSDKQAKFLDDKIKFFLGQGIAGEEDINVPSEYNSPVVCANKPQPAKEEFCLPSIILSLTRKWSHLIFHFH
jgi:hypothetical protein